jgi:hypothetical protein
VKVSKHWGAWHSLQERQNFTSADKSWAQIGPAAGAAFTWFRGMIMWETESHSMMGGSEASMNNQPTRTKRQKSPQAPSAVGAAVALVTSIAVWACESPEPPKQNPLAELASANRILMGEPAPSPAPAETAAVPIRTIARRPGSEAELMLTDERRARIEREFPQAKGFLNGDDLERQLFEAELKRGKESAAVAAFDRMARGKWILFTANIIDPSPLQFRLPVKYTPQDAKDPMGLTATWFGVEFTHVQGYEPEEYEVGEPASVLAKYEGKKKATEGYDLLLLNKWFVSGGDRAAK